MVNPCDFNLSGMPGWLAHPQRMRDYQCLSTRFSQRVLKHIAVSGVWNTVPLHLFCYSSFSELDPASIPGLMMSTAQGQEDKYQKPPNMMKYTVYMWCISQNLGIVSLITKYTVSNLELLQLSTPSAGAECMPLTSNSWKWIAVVGRRSSIRQC